MTDKKVAQETVSKALESLLDLAKGHSSRGTATTAVESMRDAGAGAGGSGGPQVFHTPSNSDPKGWAGSTPMPEAEDGAHDDIDENGTDYRGVSHGLRKSIMAKLAKGQALTEAEMYVLKSILAKSDDRDADDMDKGSYGPSPADAGKADVPVKKGKDSDDDDEDDKPFGKSLVEHASENEDVSKGLEMSHFLAGWARVQDMSLQSAEARIVDKVTKSLARIAQEDGAFQVELAKSVGALAEVMALQGQRLEQLESTPARGPKSAQTPHPQVVEKSFGHGGAPQAEQLQKSQVLDTMLDMVHKSLLPAQEVVKFESTGELREELYQAVLAHRASNGR